jgi:hypothetical protein
MAGGVRRAVGVALAVSALAATAAAERRYGPVSSIGPIAKEHNVKGADNLLYLKLRIPATIHGQKGNPVSLGVWFADDSGSLIKSAMPEHADRSGFLSAESVAFRVAYDPARRDFELAVPYNAFPRRVDRAKRYFVEARAKLVRRGPGGATIASATTTFWVEQD